MSKYLDVLKEPEEDGEGCLEGCLKGCLSGGGCLIVGGGLFMGGVYGFYKVAEYFLN